jgi:hypothetical protein
VSGKVNGHPQFGVGGHPPFSAIIEQAKHSAYQAVNETVIKHNRLLGMGRQHEVLKEQRAEYGEQIITKFAII